MNPISNFPLNRISTFRNFHSGIPWGGSFDSSKFVTGDGPFNPAIVIKWLPLTDMSRPSFAKLSDFDAVVDNVRNNLKNGDRVSAIAMSSESKNGEAVSGIVHNISYDYENGRVHIFVRSMDDLEIFEVHPETVVRDLYKDANESLRLKGFRGRLF